MTCREVEEQEILERYVLGRLTDSERDAFEQHYFECDPCLEQLQMGIVLQQDLRQAFVPQRARRVFFEHMKIWVPAFAALVLLLGLGVRWYTGRSRPEQTALSRVPKSSVSPAQPSTSSPLLEELARVEAPPYSEVVLRGAEDDAQSSFRKAMRLYMKQDYIGAVPRLRAAVKASPQTARFNFYLGACYLLTGQTDAAVLSLGKTISLKDPAYSEPAHFYLAKAYLRNHNLSHAEKELRIAARPGGSKAAEAAEILHQLGK